MDKNEKLEKLNRRLETARKMSEVYKLTAKTFLDLGNNKAAADRVLKLQDELKTIKFLEQELELLND